MALIIAGMECKLCRQPMEAEDELVAFPPFVANTFDSLYIFHDAAVHKACFDKHPLAAEALKRIEEVDAHREYICSVCGQQIAHPDDYFMLGRLTGDETDPLYPFNFLQFHISHLPLWSHLPKVTALIRELQNSGQWGGRALEGELKYLEKALNSR